MLQALTFAPQFLNLWFKAFVRRIRLPGESSTQAKIKQLTTALRAGFGTSAAKQLEAIESERQLRSADRAAIAWALSGWYSSVGQFERALHYLTLRRLARPIFTFDDGQVLLEVEALLRLGFGHEARALIEEAVRRRGEVPELCFCAANVTRIIQGLSQGDVDRLRLSWLNRPFVFNRIGPLELKDLTRPLGFDNITALAAPIARSACTPKISVLMPAYNAEKTIGLAIESIVTQSWTNLELIVVDDSSTDGTGAIILSYAQKDSRIKPMRHEVNRGAYAARNTALGQAAGDFVTVNDADDWSHPQRLALQAEHLQLTDVALNTTTSIRVGPDLHVEVTSRAEMMRESFPSLMTRRQCALNVGGWDQVRMSADAEFYARLLAAYQQSKAPVLQDVPLMAQLKRDDSLTGAPYIGRSTTKFGARREYAEAYTYWHGLGLAGGAAQLKLSGDRRSFPVPSICKVGAPRCRQYDILWVSDFSRPGIASSINMIRAAKELGLRSACFHWPRLEFAGGQVDLRVRQLIHEEVIDSVVAGERLTCSLVIAKDMSFLMHVPDVLPKVRTRAGVILVDERPETSSFDGKTVCNLRDAIENACQVFGVTPTLAPASPLVRRVLQAVAPAHALTKLDWTPIIDQREYLGAAASWDDSRRPVVGHYSYADWDKWPLSQKRLRQAYGADQSIVTRFRGHETKLRNLLGTLPSNWSIDSTKRLEARSFLGAVDFFVHYADEHSYEAFPYNALEAMASGCPVILPPRFETIFESAAVYAQPAEVAPVIQALWGDRAAYKAQIRRGLDYVARNCSFPRFEEYLVATSVFWHCEGAHDGFLDRNADKLTAFPTDR